MISIGLQTKISTPSDFWIFARWQMVHFQTLVLEDGNCDNKLIIRYCGGMANNQNPNSGDRPHNQIPWVAPFAFRLNTD